MTRLRTLALGIWAAFFWWLWLSGSMVRFIGPRTSWIVPFGALGLSAIAVGSATSRRASDEGVTLSGLAAVVGILIPLLMLVVVPSPRLGAVAASNRASGLTGGGLLPPPGGDGEVSLRDIEYASSSADLAASLGLTEGRRVTLEGFVTHELGGTYTLARFSMWCCAADAVPSSVAIEDGRDYHDDTWVEVTGELARNGSDFVIVASRVREIPVPDNEVSELAVCS